MPFMDIYVSAPLPFRIMILEQNIFLYLYVKSTAERHIPDQS